MKKYRLTSETISYDGHMLHRIQCVNSFFASHFNKTITEGELGGFVESDANLSQEGECWVDKDSMVYGNAEICGNAFITHNSVIHGNALIRRNVCVMEANIKGDAIVSSPSDYTVFPIPGSAHGFVTWTKSDDRWSVGKFYGSSSELVRMAYEHGSDVGEMYSIIVQAAFLLFPYDKEFECFADSNF